jgi:predicted  nucleic acid-binding Zn-ribbon protein
MSRSRNLYRLQQIDTEISQANARLQEIKTLLSDNASLHKAAALAERAQKNLDAAQKSLRQAERKVQEQRIKIEQTEAALYSGNIRNPKELKDLQAEAAALKRYLAVLEERQLEAMLAVDDAAIKNQEAQKILAKYRTQAETQNARLRGERSQLTEQVAALTQKRQHAAQAITPDDLDTYERLRKQRAGVAVAAVKNRSCAACGATLTAALYQAAHSPSKLVRCASCGRILHG